MQHWKVHSNGDFWKVIYAHIVQTNKWLTTITSYIFLLFKCFFVNIIHFGKLMNVLHFQSRIFKQVWNCRLFEVIWLAIAFVMFFGWLKRAAISNLFEDPALKIEEDVFNEDKKYKDENSKYLSIYLCNSLATLKYCLLI